MKISSQIADIVWPVDGKSSFRLNIDFAKEIDPITSRPIELLQKLLDSNVPNKSNQHIFDEVKKYITQNS